VASREERAPRFFSFCVRGRRGRRDEAGLRQDRQPPVMGRRLLSSKFAAIVLVPSRDRTSIVWLWFARPTREVVPEPEGHLVDGVLHDWSRAVCSFRMRQDLRERAAARLGPDRLRRSFEYAWFIIVMAPRTSVAISRRRRDTAGVVAAAAQRSSGSVSRRVARENASAHCR